jgi:hypothetical protein
LARSSESAGWLIAASGGDRLALVAGLADSYPKEPITPDNIIVKLKANAQQNAMGDVGLPFSSNKAMRFSGAGQAFPGTQG